MSFFLLRLSPSAFFFFLFFLFLFSSFFQVLKRKENCNQIFGLSRDKDLLFAPRIVHEDKNSFFLSFFLLFCRLYNRRIEKSKKRYLQCLNPTLSLEKMYSNKLNEWVVNHFIVQFYKCHKAWRYIQRNRTNRNTVQTPSIIHSMLNSPPRPPLLFST